LYKANQVMRLMEKGMSKVTPKLVFTLPTGLPDFFKVLEEQG